MTFTGHRIRRIAVRMFSARTMEQLIDPVLADLQTEYNNAVRHGRVSRGRWIRLAGCVTLLKSVAWYGCERSMRTIHDWTADDRDGLGRTVSFSLAAIAATTTLLLVPPMLHVPSTHVSATLLLYVIPQALPLAIPVGLTLGILYGLRGRVVSHRSAGAVVAIAGFCSVASFVIFVWVLPAANQAFRVSVYQALRAPGAGRTSLMKGPNELTLRELSQRIQSNMRAGQSFRGLAYDYHVRWALPCATLVLALFALSVVTRCRGGRFVYAVAACSAYLGYYLFLFAGREYARDGTLPAFAAAWLPNVVIIGVSAALLKLLPQRLIPTVHP
jgi:hypothetical protein